MFLTLRDYQPATKRGGTESSGALAASNGRSSWKLEPKADPSV